MRASTASRGEHLPIGKISRLSGVNIETIRYYERIKMLPAPRRTTSGRRVYSTTELRILAFIRRSRELGFSLNEIRALLRLGAPMTIQKGTAWKASPPTARRSVSIAFECRLGVADCLPDYVSAATEVPQIIAADLLQRPRQSRVNSGNSPTSADIAGSVF